MRKDAPKDSPPPDPTREGKGERTAGAPTREGRRTTTPEGPPDLRRFKPLFFSYDWRPGRDGAWYNRESINNAHDPSYMKREFPKREEEAFEAAEGRVYPLFAAEGEQGQKFLRVLSSSELAGAEHYRGIDFGSVDAFVCLWACVPPGEPAGFSIDPRCTNTIRELLSYRYDEKNCPLDEDNHAPDALRYLIITPGSWGLEGHVHVYRELYVENAARKGQTLIELAQKIGVLSGGQRFKVTAADRSRPDDILMLSRQGIPTVSAKALRGERRGELAQGIARVNILINATATAGEGPVAPPKPKPPKSPPRMDFRVRDTRPAMY